MSSRPSGPGSLELDEHVLLEVPASTEHLRLVRLLVASLATSYGADLNDLEDLRIATGEVCAHVIGAARPGDRLGVRAEVRTRDGRTELVLRATVAGLAELGPLDELSSMVLDAAAERHGVDIAASGAGAWFGRSVHPAGSVESVEPPVD